MYEGKSYREPYVHFSRAKLIYSGGVQMYTVEILLLTTAGWEREFLAGDILRLERF